MYQNIISRRGENIFHIYFTLLREAKMGDKKSSTQEKESDTLEHGTQSPKTFLLAEDELRRKF
jgi:hypothetical protein